MQRATKMMIGLVAVLAALSHVMAASLDPFPDVIALPNGWRPEGIAAGLEQSAYVGSLETGAIYRVNLQTGYGEVLVPPQPAGRIAVGLAYDRRTNLIFAAGGPAGAAYVYDAHTGANVGVYAFTNGGMPSFVNDVVLTKHAAYFTDSLSPNIYKVPLGADGQPTDTSSVLTIPLSGDFVFIDGEINANGIEVTGNGASLIIGHSTLGLLYLVNPGTGEAKLIDLGGGSVINADGLLLLGQTLFVVQNLLNQISVLQLKSDYTGAETLRVITHPDFDVPTSMIRFGNSIYAVNARFGAPSTPDTEYDVVRIKF